jgi:pimeloyl-ACP methyl ester carboxylesterase
VAEAGAGDPLVLLHGWPQHWFAWRKLIPKLAESYRVVCPDLRGLGWTQAPPEGYEKDQLASDLIAVVDALELERVRLVGHDWGGFAGFLTCLREPERVERYVAMSIITPWYKPPKITPRVLAKASYQFVIAAPLAGRLVMQRAPMFVETVFKRGAERPEAWTEEELASFVDLFRERERAMATVQLYRTFQLHELRPIAKGRYAERRLTMPTLALYGEHDPVISGETFAGAEDHCDDLSVEQLAGVGHFPAEEDPGAVLERIEPFLAAGPSGR